MRNRCIAAAFAAVVMAGVQPLSAQCTPRALIIGISTYKDASYFKTKLPYADKDAIAFDKWFKQSATCGPGSKPPVTTLLTNEQAERSRIMRELDNLMNASSNDEVFIFISGRGLKTPGDDKGYLLGYDAVREKLRSSGVTVQNLKDKLPASGAVSRVFVFADISRDEPDLNDIVSDLKDKLGTNTGLGAVVSAKFKQLSQDDGQDHEGLFTHFLIEQLENELKANPGKRISLDSMYQSLSRKVLENSKRKQEPVLIPQGKQGNQGATGELFPHQQVLLASLNFMPRGALAFQRPIPAPPQANRVDSNDALDEAFRLEGEAQRVLLRYGEGNQFPDDPLRPKAEDFDRAADLFDRALKVRPTLPMKELDDRLRNSLTARVLFCRGRALAYRGQYDAARTILQRAQKADPDQPLSEPDNAIGITYLEQGKYRMAEDAFHNSMNKAPDWAYPRHNLALTYIEMGDNTRAEQAYRDAIKRMPQHPYLYYNLGILLQRINRRVEAEQMFSQAIMKFEQQADAYNEVANDLNAEDPREHPDAKSEADLANKQAEIIRKNEAEAYNALGALWQARGNMKKAGKNYESAWDKNPELWAAQYNLGALAVQQRKYPHAVEILKALFEANPSFPEAGHELDCANRGQKISQTHGRQAQRSLWQEAVANGCVIR